MTCGRRDVCSTPQNIHDSTVCSATQKSQSLPIVSVIDRVHHLEGYVASFVAENSLSFSFAPKLIQFAKECARDPKALDKLEMSRTTVEAYRCEFML